MTLPDHTGHLWLNLMNWALGVSMLACIVAVIIAAIWPPHRPRLHR